MSGKAGAQLEWHTPDGGFKLKFNAKACLNVGGIEIGPVSFNGYKKCINY